ncbi:AarF/ABC1/UbiB kinase family protein [Nocardioides sp. MAH-18]|uniref:AarF/ABC1/UbiB kinase family protein n=1 Tax=Nocardioides agri TaxID=2682843 RepID=A0A6L6XTP7_9ACTN|nr:AarF/ABC1/UbiB kinase family protein [Nocardioides sp. CGMCC 1.13656]MBA2954153.1 AarF/ABC1/UbiB kinase family protein [Nocardioides sp. CGMCC 1.13656]MVQ49015.1 AarF/ABC1/UbiB kinase family protein [Nocardioides sp. MAH-18]
MTELPRKAVARTARLAALPIGYAGRSALGLGKRIGGKPAEAVMSEIQQRTAEQLFRTLGELKGGAMKFGQMLSVMESAFPEEMAGPYREHLTLLQDAAPPMPTSTVREILAADLGADWQERLVWLDGGPTAAASIGQVHRGRWVDGRDVAVKVQYPGAGDALRSDLRAIARVARTAAPLVPGLDLKPLVEELQARAADELDYALEASAQRAFAEAFRDDPAIVVPDVVAVGPTTLVTEWLDSPASLASVIATGSQEDRDHYGELFVRFLFSGPARTGMLHADPHPGNYRVLPDGRLGVLDFGAVARLPDQGLPEAMGRLLRIAAEGDEERFVDGLRDEGFIKERIQVDAGQVLDYLAPFVEPTKVERFRFSREWMRTQFARVNDPRSQAYTVGMKLNLPPSYLLIHRTWIAGLGVLCQLECEAPFRQILTESLPGFAD